MFSRGANRASELVTLECSWVFPHSAPCMYIMRLRAFAAGMHDQTRRQTFSPAPQQQRHAPGRLVEATV